jgi:hypothetical protein
LGAVAAGVTVGAAVAAVAAGAADAAVAADAVDAGPAGTALAAIAALAAVEAQGGRGPVGAAAGAVAGVAAVAAVAADAGPVALLRSDAVSDPALIVSICSATFTGGGLVAQLLLYRFNGARLKVQLVSATEPTGA